MVRNPFRKEEPTTDLATIPKPEAPVESAAAPAPPARVVEQEINLSLLNSKLNYLIEHVEGISSFLARVSEDPPKKN